MIGRHCRLAVLMCATALAGACQDDSAHVSPTAPSPVAPSPPTLIGTFGGSVTILGADPGRDCLAKALAGDADSAHEGWVTLVQAVEGAFDSVYYLDFLDAHGWGDGCGARIQRMGGGALELELRPCYPPLRQGDWTYGSGCAPADAVVEGVRLILPEPAGNPVVIHGPGSVTLRRSAASAPDVTIALFFDLEWRL